MVDKILAAGAEASVVNEAGAPPMHKATSNGHVRHPPFLKKNLN